MHQLLQAVACFGGRQRRTGAAAGAAGQAGNAGEDWTLQGGAAKR